MDKGRSPLSLLDHIRGSRCFSTSIFSALPFLPSCLLSSFSSPCSLRFEVYWIDGRENKQLNCNVLYAAQEQDHLNFVGKLFGFGSSLLSAGDSSSSMSVFARH